MRSDIAAKVEAAAARPGAGALVGVFAFVLLMIVREGMETAACSRPSRSNPASRDLLVGVRRSASRSLA